MGVEIIILEGVVDRAIYSVDMNEQVGNNLYYHNSPILVNPQHPSKTLCPSSGNVAQHLIGVDGTSVSKGTYILETTCCWELGEGYPVEVANYILSRASR